ncbi:MAG: hypothetical protein VX498_09745 [Myxococcota bacterium]|nr:hypothetical protein [Myxococcota bacterium]
MAQRRLSSLLVMPALLAFLAACPSGEGTLDLSDVPDGEYGVAYDGQIRVLDYTGPVRLTLTGGELVSGLDLNEAGRINGVPEYARLVEIEVLASDMQGIEDFTEEVVFEISATNVADAFLGYEHSQLNNFDQIGGRMRDIWLRVAGGGEDQSTWRMNPGIYLPGDNNQNDRGRGDDERIGDLDFSSLEVSLDEWDPTYDPQQHDHLGDGVIGTHVPEDDPPQLDETSGTFTSGADGGEQDLELTHPDFGSLDTRIMVVPPDWCPNGSHDGHNAPGYCDPGDEE